MVMEAMAATLSKAGTDEDVAGQLLERRGRQRW
jgi:hypothetical protein